MGPDTDDGQTSSLFLNWLESWEGLYEAHESFLWWCVVASIFELLALHIWARWRRRRALRDWEPPPVVDSFYPFDDHGQ